MDHVTGRTQHAAHDLATRIAGAAGCVAVATIHVMDQHGLPGSKEPSYVQLLYYVLEASAVVAAGFLLTGERDWVWLLSLGVAAAPIVGYVLSRGPGLPDYRDDMGNWTEPLGVSSLFVEGLLLILTASLIAARGELHGRQAGTVS